MRQKNTSQNTVSKSKDLAGWLNLLRFNPLLICALFIIVAFITFDLNRVSNRSNKLNKEIREYKENFLKKQKILSELQNTNSSIKSVLFLHLLSDRDNLMNEYRDEFRRLYSQNANGFNELTYTIKSEEELQFLNDLNRSRAKLFSQSEYFINLSHRHLKTEAGNYFTRSLTYAFSLYSIQLQNMCDYIDRSTMTNYDIIQKQINSNYIDIKRTVTIGFSAIIVLIVLVWRIAHKLKRDNTKLNELLLHKEKTENDIRKLNEELEIKVAERTNELENANTELIQQIAAINTATIVVEMEYNGVIIFANELFCEITGFALEELIGNNGKMLRSDKQNESVYLELWSTISKGFIWKGITQNKCKDGKYIWLDSTIVPFKNTENKIIKFVSLSFDITKQIEQQIALQQQADELSVQSEELRVQQEELYEANTILSAQTQKLIASEEELKMQHEELMNSNQELEEKNQLIEERNFLINKTNSELQTIATELEKKAEELSLSSKYKSEFLANMSHELRTPLNSILLLSRLLADNNDNNLNADQIEYAQVINNSGKGLLELINEILDLSKIEAGKMDVNKENIPLEYLCKSADNIFKPLARNKGIEFISTILQPVSAEIFTDRIRVEQVLKNLISNAVKFTEHGKVELKVFSAPAELISQSELVAGDYIAFEVSDSGIGIPANKLEHIFGAFQQADGSTQRKYGGTGLGLAISREIAHLLNGEIILRSELNKGSVFTFIIPAKEQHITDTSETITADIKKDDEPVVVNEPEIDEEIEKSVIESLNFYTETGSGKEVYLTDKALNGKNVLIVDDDNRNVFSLIALLKKQNINITTAGNGREALNTLEKNSQFDLVLMDMMMPELDGYDTVRAMRKNSKLKDLPVIAITAKVMQGEKEKCFEAGVSDYITKPVAGDQLLSLIKIWLYK